MLEKAVIIKPTRNLVTFNRFEDIKHGIFNQSLELMIATLKLIIPIELLADGKSNITIRRNHINYSMFIATINDTLTKIIFISFGNARECCNLEINGRIYRNGLYKDILSLEYQPHSFRQTDDSIRHYMLEWFQHDVHRNLPFDNILFFGGECTLLGKVLSGYCKRQYFFTDFQSIYEDIIHNYKQPHAALIDYSKWKAVEHLSRIMHDRDNPFEPDTYPRINVCIINTGYHGMGSNLACEVAKIAADVVWVISCNEDSWHSDWSHLDSAYEMLDKLEIRTNYSVWIYKLAKK